MAYLKSNGIVRWKGGANIQENFIYKPLVGAAYAKGTTFDLTARRTDEGMTFDLKHHYVNVTLNKEDIQIYNKGPEAVYRIIDSKLTNAALTMSAILAIELYNNGQDSGRTNNMNGLAEAISDGSTNSWNGNTYTSYGKVTRSAVNSALNATVTNINGPITYKTLEENYNTVAIGAIEPNLIVTTRLGLSYIKEKFHPQYRITSNDPKIGFTGISFNKAMIMQSSYAPGTKGVNDTDLGNYNASAGETIFMLVTDYMKLYVTDDPEFGFGFSGFKWAQDSTMVAGQYFASLNLVVTAPRLMFHGYGITG